MTNDEKKMMMDEIVLVKYLSGELSDIEIKEVELWLDIPENKLEFEKLTQLWDGSANLKDVDLFVADKSWADMKQRMDDFHRKTTRQRNLSIIKYAVAASLILIFGLASFFIFQKNKTHNLIQYTAGNTKLEKPVILPDGTTVYLNRNTSISFSKHFNEKTRTISLTGEAFFDVTKNPAKPFIIRTSTTEIKVVGTSFNVMAYAASDSVQVSVQSGVVEMYSKTDKESKLRLTVGNEGTLFKKNQKLQSKKIYDSNVLAWKTNQLNFKNADMNYVASALEHAFGKDIVLQPGSFKNCRLTVNFSNQSLDTILKVIKETLKISVSNQKDVYILSGPGC